MPSARGQGFEANVKVTWGDDSVYDIGIEPDGYIKSNSNSVTNKHFVQDCGAAKHEKGQRNYTQLRP